VGCVVSGRGVGEVLESLGALSSVVMMMVVLGEGCPPLSKWLGIW
jgi:hypothetical protein